MMVMAVGGRLGRGLISDKLAGKLGIIVEDIEEEGLYSLKANLGK